MTATPVQPDRSASHALSAPLQILFAVACGVMVANVYYAQPLVALIAPDLGLAEHAAGLVVTATQLGYAAALLLVTPLADMIDGRRLVLGMIALTIVALCGIAVSGSATVFLLLTFVAGAGSTAAQVLVPMASYMAPPESRGRTIGNVMSGLLGGIMLARPLASFVAAHGGWRDVFWLSAVLMAGIGLLLARALPRTAPTPGLRYGPMVVSIANLFRLHPALRRRTAYQALVFATFQLFWTAVPLELARRFGMSQSGIALFALAGAGGALCAPLAGRLADAGFTRPATGLTVSCVMVAFALAGWSAAALSLAGLVVSAILLDAAAQSNQIFSQRIVFEIDAAARARLNAGYMTVVFIGGASGAFLGALTYSLGDWPLVCVTGAGLALVVLALFATEFRKRRSP